MPRDFDWYVQKANDLIERDAARDRMFRAIDRMVHLEYSLPEKLQELEWMRRYVSTKPYDAVRAAVRTLTGLDERIRIEPVTVAKAIGNRDVEGISARTVANEWETALKWQMDGAARRHPIVREDITRSAVMYDEVCGMVVHLPTQIRAIEQLGGDTKRQKAALAAGDYAVLIRNPLNVHTVYSDYMAEAVLYVRVLTPQEIKDFWGKKANALDDDVEFYVLFDYVDYERRYVWAAEGPMADSAKQDDALIILDEPWTEPFLPWVCVLGGTGLEGTPEHQRFPLLYAPYRAEQWITANVLGSLAVSQAIAEMGRPSVKVTGPNPEQGVQYEFGQPGGEYRVAPGHDVVDMAQKQLDPQLREVFDRFEVAMAEATVPRVLLTAETIPGEAYSGYDLRVKQAIGALIPYKRTSERWFAETYRTMLLQAEAAGDDIRGYGRTREDLGKLYEIKAHDIDPDTIHISVEMEPDNPLDKQQRMNAAVLMAQQLPYPTADILQELGETNPEGKYRQWMREQLTKAYLAGITQRIQMEASGQLQQAAEQMAMQMQQQAAEEAQQGQPNQQASPGAPPGMTGVGGIGVNPAQGGMPPAMANPAQNTREMQTGLTRGGGERLA